MLLLIIVLFVLALKFDFDEDIATGIISFILVIMLIICLVAAVNYFETTHMHEERQVLIDVMDDFTEGDLTNSPIIEEIVDFNQEVTEYQSMHENPWFNFGISKKVMDVKIIENGGQ